MANKDLTCVEELFEMVSKNQKFVRFLKEEGVYKLYNRLIKMPKFRPYHEQTLRSKTQFEHFKTGEYFIIRAFPWVDEEVLNAKINWRLLNIKWEEVMKNNAILIHRKCDSK